MTRFIGYIQFLLNYKGDADIGYIQFLLNYKGDADIGYIVFLLNYKGDADIGYIQLFVELQRGCRHWVYTILVELQRRCRHWVYTIFVELQRGCSHWVYTIFVELQMGMKMEFIADLRKQYVQIFPEAVNSICSAYTVDRDFSPYVETMGVSSCGQIPVSLSSEPEDVPALSVLRDIEWSREQLAYPNVYYVYYCICCLYHVR